MLPGIRPLTATALALLWAAPALAQVPVTFHYAPPADEVTDLYLAGSFNGWNGGDPAYRLTDPDGDGVYEVTVPLATGTHYYSFARSGASWVTDPDNPLVSPPEWGGNSFVEVADPMVTYLLPRDGAADVRYGASVRVVLAHTDGRPVDPASIRLTVDGVAVADPQSHYDAARRTLTYRPPAPFGPGEHTVEVAASSAAGTVTRASTFRTAPPVRLLTEPALYRSPGAVVYGEVNDPALREVRVEVAGAATTVPVVDGRFQLPVTLAEGETLIRASAPGGAGPAAEQALRFEPLLDPRVEVTGTVSGRSVTLAVAEPVPTGRALAFVWGEEPGNPGALGVAGRTGPSVTFTVPDAHGEYYVSATATDAAGRSFTARRYVTSGPDGVALNDVGGRAAWTDRMVIYEVNLLLFSESRDLRGLHDRLGELADLGVNVLYLMPLVESESIDGYRPTDYFAVRPSYGTEADLRAFVDAAHARGMRVVLDLVYNHTGDAHPFFRNVRALRGASPFAGYYVWDGEPGASAHGYELFPSMPNINYEDPEAREYFLQAAEHWVRAFNVDGFRADVANGVQKRSPAFWTELRRRVKNVRPDFFLLAESSPPLDPYFEEKFDAAYDHDLRGYGYVDQNVLPALLSGTGSIEALDLVVRRPYANGGLPYRYAETHDKTRVPAQWDAQRSKLAHTLVFTVNGVPNIWAGAEYGEDAPLYQMSDVVDRTDPHGLRPYFRRLVDLRRRYVRNDAVVARLPNTAPAAVYSYATASDTTGGTAVVVAALNFSGERRDVAVDLRGALGGGALGPVTDLLGGAALPDGADPSAYPLSLEPYGAAVLLLGGAAGPTSADGAAPSGAAVRLRVGPNPSRGRAAVEYELPAPADVRLAVYDVLGREVAVLEEGPRAAGTHRVGVGGPALPSGTYFVRLEAGGAVATGRVTLVR